jgi:hypothetical protein
VTIGDTLTDPLDPRPLPRLDVDAPTLRMTFGVNTSPMAGRDGTFLTSRQIKARLEREVLGNVAIEVHPTESGETFEVRGRGELQLAVLIEQMRREGYELTISRPEVILRDGQEPYERVTIDIPPDYIGTVQGAMAGRRGRLEQMTTDADGRVRMEFIIPTRGLIGYRGQLLSDTRGTALMHQIGEGYGPMAGEVTHRTSGVLIADRAGESRAYALSSLVERAELFIGPSTEVYEGMIIGENSRPDDMDVNPTKSKALSKMRTQATDGDYRIHTPPRVMTLESSIEFIAADELVEVTPAALRLRKRILSAHDRRRAAGAAYKASVEATWAARSSYAPSVRPRATTSTSSRPPGWTSRASTFPTAIPTITHAPSGRCASPPGWSPSWSTCQGRRFGSATSRRRPCGSRAATSSCCGQRAGPRGMRAAPACPTRVSPPRCAPGTASCWPMGRSSSGSSPPTTRCAPRSCEAE